MSTEADDSDFLNKLDKLTISEVARKFGLSKTYIRKLIDLGYIKVWPEFGSSEDRLGYEDINRLKVISKHPEYKSKVLAWNPSSYYYYSPELIEYYSFHDFLDRYCWLIKLFYGESGEIKKRKYSIDVLFQRFVKSNNISVETIRNALKSEESNIDKSVFHLQKAWYNEIARSLPLKSDFLNADTRISEHVGEPSSVAWNITQTYYSVYEYTNAIDFLFCKELNTINHRNPTTYFNTNILDKIKDHTFQYPLSLRSRENDRIIFPKHTKWKYASYPRDSSKRLSDLNKDVITELLNVSKANDGQKVSLIDFLRDFRIWANYTGIESIIQLKKSFLLDHLYRNLALVNFFIAGASEILLIARMGEIEYRKVLDNFIKEYLFKQSNMESDRLYVPLLVRHRIYHHLGILEESIPYATPEHSDPVSFLRANELSEDELVERELVGLSEMKIDQIAKIVIKDWKKIDPHAEQDLEAMLKLKTVNDRYGLESGKNIVVYFLIHSQGWTGPMARVIKKELTNRIKDQ